MLMKFYFWSWFN